MARFFARFKTISLAVVLLSLSLMMMSSKIDPNKINLRTYIFSLVLSVERFFVGTKDFIVGMFTTVYTVDELQDKLEEAEKRIAYYKELSRLYTQLKTENEQLREMLMIRENLDYTAHYSKIIFRDPSLTSDYFLIDKGFNDGIRVNMPVVYSTEQDERLVLVGKTLEVGANFARVHVLTARNSYVKVRLLSTGYSGLLSGQGSWNQNLVIDYVPIEAKPRLGEVVISAGGSDIYPEGLYVGEIQGIGRNLMEEFFQTLYVKPGFNYNKITDVFVLDYVNEFTSLIEEMELTSEGE